MYKLFGSLFVGFVSTIAIPVIPLCVLGACSASPETEAQLAEGEQWVRRTGRIDARPDGRLILIAAEGRHYLLSGKLTGMIRDFYNGKVLKLDGKVIEEPDGDDPGRFMVQRIAIRLD